MGQPEAEVCDQRGRLQLTGSEAFFGGTAPDGCLDLVDLGDAAQAFSGDRHAKWRAFSTTPSF
jgi:hypothetical protein